MAKSDGFNPPKEEKKIWVVLSDVSLIVLENKLNEYALLGYQAYRIDRIPEPHNLTNEPRYDVILFNPVLLGEINAVGMTEMMSKIAAGAGKVAGPAPGA